MYDSIVFEMKIRYQKGTCTPCVLQHYLQYQDMEATWVSMNKWISKEDVTYIYTVKYYSAMRKRKFFLPFVTRMDLEDITLSKISPQRKTNIVWYHLHHLYVESKKVKLIETDSVMVIIRGWGRQGILLMGMKLQLNCRWINSGDLMQSIMTIVSNAALYTLKS